MNKNDITSFMCNNLFKSERLFIFLAIIYAQK